MYARAHLLPKLRLVEAYADPQSFVGAGFLQLAMQEAVLIGKIARFDVPVEWPDLIPYLQTVRPSATLPNSSCTSVAPIALPEALLQCDVQPSHHAHPPPAGTPMLPRPSGTASRSSSRGRF